MKIGLCGYRNGPNQLIRDLGPTVFLLSFRSMKNPVKMPLLSRL